MSQEPFYTIENGYYVFYLRGVKLFECNEVAILFDCEANVLLKHGTPEMVQATYNQYRAALGSTELSMPLANALTLVQGTFPVEELNKVVSICDYVGRFYSALTADRSVSTQ